MIPIFGHNMGFCGKAEYWKMQNAYPNVTHVAIIGQGRKRKNSEGQTKVPLFAARFEVRLRGDRPLGSPAMTCYAAAIQ